MAPLLLAVVTVLAIIVLALAAGLGGVLIVAGVMATRAAGGARGRATGGRPGADAEDPESEEREAAPPPQEELPEELADLPPWIREKIRLNPETRGLAENPGYLPAVGSPPALVKIDEAIASGCVAEPSLYEQSRPGVVDGYAVRIFPAGWRIYKAFLGFLTEAQVKQFARANPGRPSWMGDKYLAYAIARTDWGSIVSFRLERDLALLDYFDPANLERLVAEIEEHAAEFPKRRPAADVIRAIRMATGFGLSVAEHVRALAAHYPDWRGVWYYTEPRVPRRTSLHCRHRAVEGLDPIGAVRDVHSTDLAVFDAVLARHPGIDGLVRDSVRSRLDEAGVFYHEEYLVKGSAQLEKLRYDRKDPVAWPSWPLRDIAPPRRGLHLEYTVKKFASSDRISPNANFALARFYLENAGAPPEASALPPGPLLLFYNVHGFVSLDADVPEAATRASVAALLAGYAGRVAVVALAEVAGTRKKVEGMLAAAGYPHVVAASNGSRDRSSRLVVAARAPLEEVAVVDTAVPLQAPQVPVDREQVVFRLPGGAKGAVVHLEIGQRLVVGNEPLNAERRAQNAAARRRQLEQVLAHGPDYVAGDFNFALGDPEAEYLAGRGYEPAGGPGGRSTPYNRVDLVFVRRELLAGGLGPESNALLRCNYSDHLPMVQTLPPAGAAPEAAARGQPGERRGAAPRNFGTGRVCGPPNR